MDPLERIEGKIDRIIDVQAQMRSDLAVDQARLAAHLMECDTRDRVLHKRIDKVAGEQTWWSRKLIGSAVGGGMFAEFMRWLVTGRHQ